MVMQGDGASDGGGNDDDGNDGDDFEVVAEYAKTSKQRKVEPTEPRTCFGRGDDELVLPLADMHRARGHSRDPGRVREGAFLGLVARFAHADKF